MDKKKFSKRKVIIPAALCAAVIVTVAAVLFGADSYRNHIRKKVLSYEQETNEQGTAQYMDDNPTSPRSSRALHTENLMS